MTPSQKPAPAEKELLHSPGEIARAVAGVARRIEIDLGAKVSEENRLLVLGVLNGAFIFMADLIRELDLPLEVDFIRLSSYRDDKESAREVVLLKAPERPVEGRHVLVVEDIADCGFTLDWLLGYLDSQSPASVSTAVCVDKRERRETALSLDYACFVEESGFLVGYGLDYARSYRGLSGIYRLKF
jgi:hypoxanthine phosphoribosyltransferase